MRTLFSVLLVLNLLASSAFSQEINWVEFIPENPGSLDSVNIVVSTTMGITGCQGVPSHAVEGNEIIASTLHCLTGGWTAFCTQIDTFTVNPLAPGEYVFHYTAYSVWGEEYPCEPEGPGNEISIPFMVTEATGISAFPEELVRVYPNPTVGQFEISGLPDSFLGGSLTIVNTNGSILREMEKISQSTLNLDSRDWSAGIYSLIFRDSFGEVVLVKQLVKHP